jgi:hypothetical protein
MKKVVICVALLCATSAHAFTLFDSRNRKVGEIVSVAPTQVFEQISVQFRRGSATFILHFDNSLIVSDNSLYYENSDCTGRFGIPMSQGLLDQSILWPVAIGPIDSTACTRADTPGCNTVFMGRRGLPVFRMDVTAEWQSDIGQCVPFDSTFPNVDIVPVMSQGDFSQRFTPPYSTK